MWTTPPPWDQVRTPPSPRDQVTTHPSLTPQDQIRTPNLPNPGTRSQHLPPPPRDKVTTPPSPRTMSQHLPPPRTRAQHLPPQDYAQVVGTHPTGMYPRSLFFFSSSDGFDEFLQCTVIAGYGRATRHNDPVRFRPGELRRRLPPVRRCLPVRTYINVTIATCI